MFWNTMLVHRRKKCLLLENMTNLKCDVWPFIWLLIIKMSKICRAFLKLLPS